MVAAWPRVARIAPEERRAVAWAFLYFFATLSSYYTLRPLREEMGIVGGVKNLPWQFTATFVVMLLVVPFYSAVVARFPRRKIIPVVYRFCALNLLVFLAADRVGFPEIWVARVFFVWASVFNLFVVAVAWSFMVDTFNEERGKRLFGAIAAGGSVGALVGPALAAVLVKPLGRPGIYLASAALLELAVFAVRRLVRWAESHHAGGVGRAPDRAVGGNPLAGFWLALRSPYLLAIAGMLLAYSATSTVIYTNQAAVVAANVADSAARTSIFAWIDFGASVLALGLQAVVTGWVLTALGLVVALAVLPLLTAGGFLALAGSPGLATLIAVQVIRRGTQYGLERPSREVLFTAVSSEEKYKAKAFIDTVIFRGGDAATAWAYAAVSSLAPSRAVPTAVMLSVCAGWLALAWWAVRRHRVLQAAAAESGA